ncbi:MAG: hypothetical protein ACRENF_07390, partial [Thermodesulfobacteriota bacterium]
NFLVHYDRDFNLLSQKEIVEDLPRERIRSINVEGLEDCRLVSDGWFTCTTFDTNPAGRPQITACHMDSHGEVEKLVPLLGPDPNRCEKNWLPFMKDGQLHLIYSCDPFILYRPDLETGVCETVLEYKPFLDFSSFRGSAAPLPFDDGYLMLVHEVVVQPDYTRVYLHRFVFLDQDFTITKLSSPFTFRHQGVEYCCGMAINHTETELILTTGIEDREAYLCFIGLDSVRSALKAGSELSEGAPTR